MPNDASKAGLLNERVAEGTYGSQQQYRDHLLAEYHFYCETVNQVAVRRNLMHSLFVVLHGAALGVLGYTMFPGAAFRSLWTSGIAAGGLVMLCLIWSILTFQYRQLNSAKFRVIGEFEETLPARPFTREWVILRGGRDWTRYIPMSKSRIVSPCFSCFCISCSWFLVSRSVASPPKCRAAANLCPWQCTFSATCSPAEKSHSRMEDHRLASVENRARGTTFPLPVVILAGGCDRSVEQRMEGYRQLLIEGFLDYRGTIISGGTRQGISGLAGDLREHCGDRLHTIGYVPRSVPIADSIDDTPSRYVEIRRTSGNSFTPLEAIWYWSDLLAAAVDPADVRLVGINGGPLAAIEYRMAVSMGAAVAILSGSGREADRLLTDPDWQGAVNLFAVPPDAEALRAFLAGRIETTANDAG